MRRTHRWAPWWPTGLAVATVAGALTLGAHAATRTAAPPVVPTVTLTSGAVPDGGTYVASASGFEPGERVRWTWTGPTAGFMGESPADLDGVWRCGPVEERDPPGSYLITATGMSSDRTASAPLRVTKGSS